MQPIKKYKEIAIGTEYETGRKINGKIEYANTFFIPSLPDTKAESYDLGKKYDLTGISIMVFTNNKATIFPLPFVGQAQANNIRFSIANQRQITITTGMDRTAYSAEVFFTYTK